MKYFDWKNKLARRSDMTGFLVHLTKGKETADGMSAINNLVKILKDKKLKGSDTKSGFIVGNQTAVCLQDTPIYSLTENIYYEQMLRKENKEKKIRYLGFGIMFEKTFIYKKGGRPVIYEKTSDAKLFLPKDQWWRIVNFDLEDEDKIIDWTHEREWRVCGDLEFNLSEIRVIVPNHKALKALISKCNYEGINIVEDTKSIINLSDIFF